tara:strand:- start:474 stop:716 length:243 start_codon:yes stop_codon:yes gene_type:complete
MSWKKIANGWLNKNTKSNPQNNLPMFSGSVKFSEDVLTGDEVNMALWRKVEYGKESFSIAVSYNTDKPEPEKKNVKSEIF